MRARASIGFGERACSRLNRLPRELKPYGFHTLARGMHLVHAKPYGLFSLESYDSSALWLPLVKLSRSSSSVYSRLWQR